MKSNGCDSFFLVNALNVGTPRLTVNAYSESEVLNKSLAPAICSLCRARNSNDWAAVLVILYTIALLLLSQNNRNHFE